MSRAKTTKGKSTSSTTSTNFTFTPATNIEEIKPRIHAPFIECNPKGLPLFVVDIHGIVKGFYNLIHLNFFIAIRPTGKFAINPDEQNSYRIFADSLLNTLGWQSKRIRNKSQSKGGTVTTKEKERKPEQTNAKIQFGPELDGRKFTKAGRKMWEVTRPSMVAQAEEMLRSTDPERNHVGEVFSNLLELGNDSTNLRAREVRMTLYRFSIVAPQMYASGAALMQAVLLNGGGTGYSVYHTKEPQKKLPTTKAKNAVNEVCGKRKEAPPGIEQHHPGGLHNDAFGAFARSEQNWNANIPLKEEDPIPCRQMISHTVLRLLIKILGGAFRVCHTPHDTNLASRYFLHAMEPGAGLGGLPEGMCHFKGEGMHPTYAGNYVLDGVNGKLTHARGPEQSGKVVLDIMNALKKGTIAFGKSTMKDIQEIVAKSVETSGMPERYPTVVVEVTGREGGNFQGFMQDLVRLC